jgi:DnaJ-class molecular chaperone
MQKLHAPKAYCTACGAAYHSEGGICHRTLGGRYDCKGIIRLASNPSYWRACNWCNGSGGYAAQTCHSCHGDGWLLAGSADAIHSTAVYPSTHGPRRPSAVVRQPTPIR